DTTFVAAQSSGYTQTETVGVWENGAFSAVPAKSSRTVRIFDCRGNEVRTEKHVHTGTAFELVFWENKTYSPSHKVIATTRSDGKTSSADYICTGPLWEIDAEGVRTDYVYDAAKRVSVKTRHGVRGDLVTNYSYDASGRIVAETESSGTLLRSRSRAYNADGSLASESDFVGNATTYTQSADGLTETVAYPDGGTQITVRGGNGDLLSVTGTAVVSRYYNYTLENGLKVTTVFTGTQNSARWEKTYEDGHGKIVKTERPGFGENITLSSENTYDSKGRLIATVSTGQPSVAYAHDTLGNVTETTQSASSVWRKTTTESVYEKDASGIIWQKTTNTVSCSDATIPAQTSVSKTQLNGLSLALESKQISLDVRGNETVTTSAYVPETKTRTQTTAFPKMTDVQTSVAVDGVVTSQTAPGGVTTSAIYDAFNRRTSATDARGNATVFAYDLADRIVSETRTLNGVPAMTCFVYDAAGRRIRTTFPDGTWIASAYDLRGNKIAEYGNASYPVKFTFDALNQKTQMQTFRTLAGTPEELANLTGGDVTTWAYDAGTGLLLTKTDASNQATVYTYNSAGLLATRTWARGIVTTYSYDAWNQLTSTSYSDSTSAVSRSYDLLGRLISVTDSAGTTTKTYDPYGNVVTETQGATGATLAFGYDAFGRETTCTISRGQQTIALFGLAYDTATGRLSVGSYGNVEFAYNYLEGTNLLASVGNYFVTKTITYESSRDLPVEIAYNDSVSTLLAKRNYSYDSLGRVVSRTQTRGAGTPRNDSFGYNSRSELVFATLGNDSFIYNYDNIGNRNSATEAGTASSYSTNNLNQYQAIVETVGGTPSYFTPIHDADGNAILVRTATGVWQISYNAENRPVRFENLATQTVITCAYDSQGRRFEKKVFVAGTTTLWERYLYRDYLQVAAFDVTESAGTLNYSLKRVIYWDPSEPVATRPLIINIVGDQLYFPTVDLTKNVCELVTLSGTLAATYDYSPFGAVTSSGTVANPLQWSSEIYDSELGLVYYNYRHYSPLDGRFLSRDPIAEQGGFCLYLFAKNSAITQFDVWGCEVFFREKETFPLWGYRGFASFSVVLKALHQGISMDISASIYGRIFFSEIIASLFYGAGFVGTALGATLELMNFKQELQFGGEGSTTIDCSCDEKTNRIICEMNKLQVTIFLRGVLGYDADLLKLFVSAKGGGKWDVITGEAFLYAKASYTAEVKTKWHFWIEANGSTDDVKFPIHNFPGIGKSKAEIPLPPPLKCPCKRYS
nr:hypothetical protein [Opitutales bacterium]